MPHHTCLCCSFFILAYGKYEQTFYSAYFLCLFNVLWQEKMSYIMFLPDASKWSSMVYDISLIHLVLGIQILVINNVSYLRKLFLCLLQSLLNDFLLYYFIYSLSYITRSLSFLDKLFLCILSFGMFMILGSRIY